MEKIFFMFEGVNYPAIKLSEFMEIIKAERRQGLTNTDY